MKKVSLIETAARIAIEAHASQKRKDDDSPYIAHPFMVAMKLLKNGFPDEVVAAALVHDVLEDTKTTEEDLKKDLGERILNIVKTLSEDKSLPWEERKKKYIESVRNGSKEAKAVSISDKIHNAEGVLAAYELEGPKMWRHFSRGKDSKLWFEEECLKMFKETFPHKMVDEYGALVAKLRQLD
ncbi:MAG: HD domain-containing protein [bacterium]|nr:HD domain-containing protein [bacterium]